MCTKGQLVFPIKIGSQIVIKSSSTHKLKTRQKEQQSHYTLISNSESKRTQTLITNDSQLTPSSQSSRPLRSDVRIESDSNTGASARRNLNDSLNEVSEHKKDENNIFNYSIVEMNDDCNGRPDDIKIKLRKSQRISMKNQTTQDEDKNILENGENRKRLSCKENTDNLNFGLSPKKRNKQIISDKNVEKLMSDLVVSLKSNRRSILKTSKCIENINNDTPKKRVQLVQSIDKTKHHHDQEKRQRIRKTLNEQQEIKRNSLQLANNDSNANLQIIEDIQEDYKSLPFREDEFLNIYIFLKDKILGQIGGCMYISGVPGTGKTATVTRVINYLKYEANFKKTLPDFDYIEINGLKLTEPRQAYVQIYKQLILKKNENSNNSRKPSLISWENALSVLEKRFTSTASSNRMIILLVDELDFICNRRQDIVYNLLDWPTKLNAKLVVLTIANTMDLPERLLKGKVTSRLGLTRLTFSPYKYQQLQQIITLNFQQFVSFKNDEIQLIARKVAAISGDVRRALDITKRAIEICNNKHKDHKLKSGNVVKNLDMSHVQQALSELISSTTVQALKDCSRLEQIFLQAILAEMTRTGIEETIFYSVYSQMETIALFIGINIPPIGKVLQICSNLSAKRLIINEHSRVDIYQKIILNVSTDDVHYALKSDSC